MFHLSLLRVAQAAGVAAISDPVHEQEARLRTSQSRRWLRRASPGDTVSTVRNAATNMYEATFEAAPEESTLP